MVVDSLFKRYFRIYQQIVRHFVQWMSLPSPYSFLFQGSQQITTTIWILVNCIILFFIQCLYLRKIYEQRNEGISLDLHLLFDLDLHYSFFVAAVNNLISIPILYWYWTYILLKSESSMIFNLWALIFMKITGIKLNN